MGPDITYTVVGQSLVIDSDGNRFELEGGARLGRRQCGDPQVDRSVKMKRCQ